MDLETENRIAAILMKEAAELRRQAEKEGVHVYLQQPKSRVRPNTRFLTATVLGVQQSNRSVETNEMWRIRQKELELDDRLKHKPKDRRSNGSSYRDGNCLESTSKSHFVADDCTNAPCSSSKSAYDDFHSRKDVGLRDEELEKFLHSRAKRGRGAVGSRMDETGPYLPRCLVSKEESRGSDVAERRIYGPEKPFSLKLSESSEEESDDERRKKKQKKNHSRSTKKQHSEKHRSKKKSKDKKRKRKDDKRSKHNH